MQVLAREFERKEKPPHLQKDVKFSHVAPHYTQILETVYDVLEFKAAYDNGSGNHGERVGDSGRREPWVLLRLKSSRIATTARSTWLPKRIFHQRGSMRFKFNYFDKTGRSFPLALMVMGGLIIVLSGVQVAMAQWVSLGPKEGAKINTLAIEPQTPSMLYVGTETTCDGA